jgi:aspartyl/asparaginyl beta-hydroxylase (cupin superfamily)
MRGLVLAKRPKRNKIAPTQRVPYGAVMATSPALAQAIAALDRGDAQTALDVLGSSLDTDADPRVALVVGEAARQSGDDVLLERAANRLIALDPALVRPLIWTGDIQMRAGNERGAAQFYGSALARAAAMPQQATLQPEIARIQIALRSLHNRLSSYVDGFLTDHDLPPARRSKRIARSLRILAGQETIDLQLQQPTVHFVPGLPQRAWYDRADFAWATAIEAQTDTIRAELLALIADGNAFKPYVEGDRHGPARDYQGLLDNPAWGAFYFWRDGKPVAENIARCPATADALEAVPRPAIAGRSPTAMFSLLRSHTRIPAHHGMLNARLIAHLPLVVPEGCAMRVGQETRPWRVGELTLFDDSVEHEAWNESDATRVVLLFDVARPELDADEARAVDLCFRAIDAYGAAADSNNG